MIPKNGTIMKMSAKFAMSGTLLSLLMCLGCGGSAGPHRPIGSVKISVTYDGQAVTEGAISMGVPNTGKGATGELGPDGSLTINEVEVGNYVVAVSPPSLPNHNPDKPAPLPKSYDNLPEKFRSLETSTFKVEVKEGIVNTFTFELNE